jgi:hypothetical protein
VSTTGWDGRLNGKFLISALVVGGRVGVGVRFRDLPSNLPSNRDFPENKTIKSNFKNYFFIKLLDLVTNFHYNIFKISSNIEAI